jgi:hypothetical protein
MPYTSQYPNQFNAVMSFLNLAVNGDPSQEDIALYQWIDTLITTCYDEAESYCGQPLRSGLVSYVFNAEKGQVGIEANHRIKFIPYNVNTSLVLLQWRANEFETFQNVVASDYAWNAESFGNYIAYRGQSRGQYKVQLQTGFLDNQMPPTILQGVAEMVALIYRLSPIGGNWFGLNSVASGGAGQTVNASLKEDIGWQKYFGLYVIPTV